jgi:hypothetical protein
MELGSYAHLVDENLSLEIDNFRTLHRTFRLRPAENFGKALFCKLVT